MYAVIKTGGKQYRVAADEVVTIEKVAGEAGSTVEFTEVLMVAGSAEPKLGRPLISGAKVTGKIVAHDRGERLVVFKFKRRKRYKRRNGHRQYITAVKITSIQG